MGAAPRLDTWHCAAGTASMAATCSVPGIRSGGGHGCHHTTPRPESMKDFPKPHRGQRTASMAAACPVPGIHSDGGHGRSPVPRSVTPCSRCRVDGGRLFCTWYPFRRWPWEQPRAWIRDTVQPVPRRWRPTVLYLASIQTVAMGAAPRLDPWHRAASTASMAATCSVPGIRSGGGHGSSPAPRSVAPCSQYRVDGGRLFCA